MFQEAAGELVCEACGKKYKNKDRLRLHKSSKFDNDGKDEEDFDEKDTKPSKICEVSLEKFKELLKESTIKLCNEDNIYSVFTAKNESIKLISMNFILLLQVT